jgi:hypothetical protein
MRHVVMFVAILGGIATAFLAFMWYQDFEANRAKFDQSVTLIKLMEALGEKEKAREAYNQLNQPIRTIPFLGAGLLMAIVGAILAMNYRGFSAALVFLAGAIGPFLVYAGGFSELMDFLQTDKALGMLVFTSGLFLAAFLSLFVWAPRPKEDRKAKSRKQEEEEEDRDDDDEPEDDED